MIIWDADDFACSHIISDMCQSHDCRDVLVKFKEANPNFKATLFAIPGEMTDELANWVNLNHEWIQLAYHGFYHTSNYECADMSYKEFDEKMRAMTYRWGTVFEEGFKAPGWQISDEIYQWLLDNDWWIGDQSYNDERRPKDLAVYKIGDNSMHHHVWNCMSNGVYEQYNYIMDRIKDETDFRFVSEMLT